MHINAFLSYENVIIFIFICCTCLQNDLIHAWGLDMKLGYCSQGDRTRKVGVVDSEYITHMGIPTLGGSKVVDRCYAELDMFNKRWQGAAEEDKCWTDPYPQA
ncbi:hypothetical protein GW17_00030469 [Ensete ventricosum]|nr:hypothetical protein GW17_00030469 [Ensete ventricosum]